MSAAVDPEPVIPGGPPALGDMDAYGHVNNVQIVRILEEARALPSAPAQRGRGPGAASPGGAIPVFADLPAGTQALVAEHTVKYRSPLPYRGDPARVEVWVQRVTRRLTVGYRVCDAATGTACCAASTVLAFVRPDGGLVRLSPEQRRTLQRHLRA
ncbi:hypothetical protein A5N15_06550 [Rothia kristinae]|uniref:Thioesterase n=1 Tax=Rothia kristinae TaxID=37923 RepID=A0A657IUK4_9MICC|nr:hypothetical protein A5N15_06550 [Rothia kristinae]